MAALANQAAARLSFVPVPRLRQRQTRVFRLLQELAEELTLPIRLEDSGGFSTTLYAGATTDPAGLPAVEYEVWFITEGSPTCPQTLRAQAAAEVEAGLSPKTWIRVVLTPLPEHSGQLANKMFKALIDRDLIGVNNAYEKKLTKKQRDIYRMLQQDVSYKDIAQRMGLAHSTVRVQVCTIRQLLGADAVPFLRTKD